MTTGLNTRDFAESIGVSQKTVNNAESDAHEVRKIVLNAWAMATGVPVEWLERGDGPTTSPPTGTDNPSLDRLTAQKRSRTRTTGQGASTHRYVQVAA